MLLPSLTNTLQELQQILRLQEENLIQHIDETEMKSQGFVTLRHDLATLEQMHRLAPSVIIKGDNNVVGYALTMLRECRQLMPDLEPMFSLFDKLGWNNKPLNDYSFYVMGQICIAKEYRSKGFLRNYTSIIKKFIRPNSIFVSQKFLRGINVHYGHMKKSALRSFIHILTSLMTGLWLAGIGVNPAKKPGFSV